ncbi:hypothetical protein [Nocardioides pacificus]
MSVEPDLWWTELVDVLGSLGMVEERVPCGLVVTTQQADGSSTVVEIVMTPEEWDELVSISWVELEAATQHVREIVGIQPPGQRYLVYDTYDLSPCDTPVVTIQGRR